MRLFSAVLVVSVMGALPVAAQETVADAMQVIRDTCSRVKDEGSFSSLTAKGQVEGNIRVKLVGKVGADAFVEMSEQEWDSIQQVMRKDQLADNVDYRACVRAMTPPVLDKLP